MTAHVTRFHDFLSLLVDLKERAVPVRENIQDGGGKQRPALIGQK